MTEPLDDTDRKLLGLLARNARAPAAEIARKAGVARSTAQARIERMERTGVIRGYTVRADPEAGALIRAYVLIQVEPRRTAAVSAALQRMPEVESLHTTSGRFDMAAQVAGDDGVVQTVEKPRQWCEPAYKANVIDRVIPRPDVPRPNNPRNP